jgi:hypothetical protein
MNYLGFSLLNEIPPRIHHKLKIKREELYKNLIIEINKTKLNKIIITAEAYSLLSTKYFLGEDAPRLLSELFKKENYTFKIITFIRRQDEYLESQYNQHIKTHNFWNLYKEDIQTFYKEKAELFEFNTIIKRWEKYFGRENIFLKVYDKNSNSVFDFLDLLGISEKLNKTRKVEVNTKLSSKALEFMRVANKFDIKKTFASENYKLIELVENALGNKKDSFKLLSTNEALLIMENSFAENKAISKKYLDNDINWCLPNYNYNTNVQLEKLTKEECIQITTHIWNHFQNKTNK